MERGEGDSRKFGLRMIRELSRKVHLRRNRYTTFDRNGLLAPNAFWYKLVVFPCICWGFPVVGAINGFPCICWGFPVVGVVNGFPCICWGFPVVGAINGFVLIIKEKLL